MSFVGVAIGGAATIVGSAISADAAGKASDKQAAAAKDANQVQWDMFQQQRTDQEPWRKAGADALTGLQDQDFKRDFTAADFTKDPGYDFRMAEGQKALERSAAARGGLQSGGTLKALARYGQDFASNEYGNAYNRFNSDRDRRFNRLSSVAGLGQTATSQLGQAGQNYASQFGSNTMGAANAAGAAGMAQANAWGGAIGGIGKNVMDASTMSWMKNQNSTLGGGWAGGSGGGMGNIA